MSALLLIAGLLLSGRQTHAQVNVNINLGTQPLWGPVGYDEVEYYYLPDVEAYYYVPRHQFVYLNGGKWIFATSLPARYRTYDLYSGYKVVINEPKPYIHFTDHKVKYAKYKGVHGKQVVIRDSRDPKYYVVKGHPGNSNKGNGPNKGKGNGKGNGNGKGKGKNK
ncbi:hypothetical protein D3H65_30825 [Paraflavitalea soli]|uniref:Uncharacterized protein n=2 Tax=Paraflavitalea soli TaxID=2315862 RepID=A0A3B7MUB8_9BACT|nr:hypothetical protein D3H65_30825 [Paraflavitalea soli]